MIEEALDWLNFGLRVIPLNDNKATLEKRKLWLADLTPGKVSEYWRHS